MADVKRAFGFQKICNFNALESVTTTSIGLFVISIPTINMYIPIENYRKRKGREPSASYKSVWIYRNNYKCHDTFFNNIQWAGKFGT